MQLFALHARLHVSVFVISDQHLCEQILEAIQLLYTSHAVLGTDWSRVAAVATGGVRPWKKTHVNHPVAVWARQQRANYVFVACFAKRLLREFNERFRSGAHRSKPPHACAPHANMLFENVPRFLEEPEAPSCLLAKEDLPFGLDTFPLCFPPEAKGCLRFAPSGAAMAVASFLEYYCFKVDSIANMRWRGTQEMPATVLAAMERRALAQAGLAKLSVSMAVDGVEQEEDDREDDLLLSSKCEGCWRTAGPGGTCCCHCAPAEAERSGLALDGVKHRFRMDAILRGTLREQRQRRRDARRLLARVLPKMRRFLRAVSLALAWHARACDRVYAPSGAFETAAREGWGKRARELDEMRPGKRPGEGPA